MPSKNFTKICSQLSKGCSWKETNGQKRKHNHVLWRRQYEYRGWTVDNGRQLISIHSITRHNKLYRDETYLIFHDCDRQCVLRSELDVHVIIRWDAFQLLRLTLVRRAFITLIGGRSKLSNNKSYNTVANTQNWQQLIDEWGVRTH